MKANIQENTDILLTAINDFTTFKNELLKSIPEKVEANLSQKHEALLEKFYKYRIYYIFSLVFSIAFGTCFTVLFWFRNAQLDDSHSAGAHAKLSYKDMFSGLFAYLEGGWKRLWSDIAYGTTLDSQAHTVIEASHMPNHSNRFSLSAYGRKDISWHTTQIELQATATRLRSEMLRQAVLSTFTTTGYRLRGSLSFDIITGCRVDYSATWMRNRSVSGSHRTTYNEWNQRGRLNMQLVPSRLILNVNLDHTHNSSLSSSRKDYVFLGSGMLWKVCKAVDLNLDGDNLTNIRRYSSRSLGDMEEYYTECRLRPLSVTLTAHIRL